MRLAKAQLPASVALKKLNQKCRILRTKDREDSGGGGGGGGGGAFIFLNIHFHDVAATNASLAGRTAEGAAGIPALELPAFFKIATFTVLKDKAPAAQSPVMNMDLWLDCAGGGLAAAEKKLIQLDRSPRAVRVAVKFKTEEEAAKAAAAAGRRREAAAEQLFWVSQWYHSRIEILTLVFRPLPPRYPGKTT
jgi:hypothetical protein